MPTNHKRAAIMFERREQHETFARSNARKNIFRAALWSLSLLGPGVNASVHSFIYFDFFPAFLSPFLSTFMARLLNTRRARACTRRGLTSGASELRTELPCIFLYNSCVAHFALTVQMGSEVNRTPQMLRPFNLFHK